MQSNSPRRGIVLVLVLVVIVLLTLTGFTFTTLMMTERKGADLTGRKAQALAAANSGVQWARFFLGKDPDTRSQSGGCYNNPNLFRSVSVVDDSNPKRNARFTLVAPVLDDYGLPAGGVRYGLENESGKINLNVLMEFEKHKQSDQDDPAKDVLMGLPGMTEDIADAILDWIDTDSETRQNGAESDYYLSQQPSYAPRNGPLRSIDELLLVRGVTPALLYGCDWNRNGQADADEPGPQSLPGVNNSDGSMSRGWSAYLTISSAENNLRPDGTPRINLNQDDLETLYDDLSSALGEEQATFIVAYRQGAPYTGKEEGEAASGEINFDTKATHKIDSVLDLIGAKVLVTFKDEKKPTILKSPFGKDALSMIGYLTNLMDNVTTDSAAATPGRINVNLAPRAVLAGLPVLKDNQDILEQIISRRELDPQQADDSRRHETWLLQEGIVDLDQMKQLMPFICGGGAVYRAEIIGYFDGGGPAARLEAIIDATNSPARVVSWRDISSLGRGFALETLGIAAQQ